MAQDGPSLLPPSSSSSSASAEVLSRNFTFSRLRTFTHDDEVWFVEVSPNGRYFAAVSGESVYVYSGLDVDENALLYRFRPCPYGGTAFACQFSSDSSLLCGTGLSQLVLVSLSPQPSSTTSSTPTIDTATHDNIEIIMRYKSPDHEVNACQFVPGSKQYLLASVDREVVIFDLARTDKHGQPATLHKFTHRDACVLNMTVTDKWMTVVYVGECMVVFANTRYRASSVESMYGSVSPEEERFEALLQRMQAEVFDARVAGDIASASAMSEPKEESEECVVPGKDEDGDCEYDDDVDEGDATSAFTPFEMHLLQLNEAECMELWESFDEHTRASFSNVGLTSGRHLHLHACRLRDSQAVEPTKAEVTDPRQTPAEVPLMLPIPGEVTNVGDIWNSVFSPDNRMLVVLSDEVVRIYDLTSPDILLNGLGEPIELRGHTKVVNSAVFSPNSDYLVTGSKDQSLRLWSLEHPITCVCTFPDAHAGSVMSLAILKNSVLTASKDHTVARWLIPRGLTFESKYMSFLLATACEDSDVHQHFVRSELFDKNLIGMIWSMLNGKRYGGLIED